MNADQAYRWLNQAAQSSTRNRFDIHIFASILSCAFDELSQGATTLTEGVGLDGSALRDVAKSFFPTAIETFTELAADEALDIDAEEQSIRDILRLFAINQDPLVHCLAAMIARRCKAPHHLWQDLGLRNRSELSQLMARHFPRLKARNVGDMKWKKFLYRLVCGSEGFSICASPICTECDDYADCFGEETGQARISYSSAEPQPEFDDLAAAGRL